MAAAKATEGTAEAAPSASETPVVDPAVAGEAAETLAEAPKPKPGWVKHIASGTLHEVDDKLTVFAAYPGQFEETDKPGDRNTKIGWPKAEKEPAAE